MKKILIILLALMALAVLNATKQIIFDTDVPLYDLEWSYFNFPGQPPSSCANHNLDEIPAGITTFDFNTPHIYRVTFRYMDYNICRFVTRTVDSDLITNDQVVITVRGRLYLVPGDPGTPIGN